MKKTLKILPTILSKSIPITTCLAFSLLLLSITHGFVLTKLWGWFISSTFNISQPPWVVASGFMLILLFITNRRTSIGNFDQEVRQLSKRLEKEERGESSNPSTTSAIVKEIEEKIISREQNIRNTIEFFISFILLPATILLFGWIIHLFL